ncbi:hypothetical protein [Mycoplasma sp. 744]|uniref:hypothetical protein n=1 Tax=Mycoplasma sp. 744 TaxID=3108531 RepID=UPI002B1D1827|nr:hypothetical protein [Mycoplasma sp. 744]
MLKAQKTNINRHKCKGKISHKKGYLTKTNKTLLKITPNKVINPNKRQNKVKFTLEIFIILFWYERYIKFLKNHIAKAKKIPKSPIINRTNFDNELKGMLLP